VTPFNEARDRGRPRNSLYASVETQVLGLVCARGDQPPRPQSICITGLAGSSAPRRCHVVWSADRGKRPRTVALNAVLRDYARLGLLTGARTENWRGRQIIPAAWVMDRDDGALGSATSAARHGDGILRVRLSDVDPPRRARMFSFRAGARAADLRRSADEAPHVCRTACTSSASTFPRFGKRARCGGGRESVRPLIPWSVVPSAGISTGCACVRDRSLRKHRAIDHHVMRRDAAARLPAISRLRSEARGRMPRAPPGPIAVWATGTPCPVGARERRECPSKFPDEVPTLHGIRGRLTHDRRPQRARFPKRGMLTADLCTCVSAPGRASVAVSLDQYPRHPRNENRRALPGRITRLRAVPEESVAMRFRPQDVADPSATVVASITHVLARNDSDGRASFRRAPARAPGARSRAARRSGTVRASCPDRATSPTWPSRPSGADELPDP